MMPVLDHTTQLERVLGGKYRLDALLGAGGMGAVYRGLQLSVHRPVAIKLISSEAPNREELVFRFRREAEATARLSHPNTVRLIDFGVTEHGELFMVMELLEGEELATRLQHGPLTPLAALRIVRQVLLALCEAHALGIVHRDLKPGNVFLSRVHGGETLVKVMDFGIAGLERTGDAPRLTFTGEVMGTPAYMSPEQAQGQSVDARSDLYSIGVMLFEMVTGKPPFDSDTIVSLLMAHVTQPPPRLEELGATLPLQAELQRLLDALLAKMPEERLASAPRALEQVEALIARYEAPPQPSAAAPVVYPVLLAPSSRRSAWLVGAGLSVITVALASWLFDTPSQAPATASAAAPPSAAEASISSARGGPGPRALTFSSFAAARKAYASGAIDAPAYEDALAMLRQRRDELIEHEKEALKSGKITPQTYADRIARIDDQLQGK